MSGCWTELRNRGVVAVAGADRLNLLQGLVTADLRTLSPERALHAAFLSPQGRWMFDALFVDLGDRLLLDTERARTGELIAWIAKRRLRADVTAVDESDAWSVLAAWGDDMPPRAAGETRAFAGGVILADPRSPDLGDRAIVPAARVGEGFAEFERVDAAVWDRRRIAAGVPDGTRDLTPDKSLPMESGFDRMGSIAFDKGCYIGQEVTARMRSRNAARRTIRPARLEGAAPARGASLVIDGAEVGRLLDGTGDLALISIRLDALARFEAGGVIEAGEARCRRL